MAEERKVNRPKRTPIELRNKLAANKRDGFVRRWVNENRYEYCTALGYRPVVGKGEDVSQSLTQDPSKQGSSLIRRDVGGGMTAILMEIPEETYREYKAAGQAELDQLEESMSGKSKGIDSYGSIKIKHGR